MSDLVERLRRARNVIGREAADEIVRLRAALVRITYKDAQSGIDAMEMRDIASRALKDKP